MSFNDLPLAALDAASIQRLIDIQAPEGLRLEFKGELDLTSREQKREAGKDASALANTIGGRILYGVTETELADGSKVASGLVPLTDGSAADKLADVLASIVTPRPHFNTHAVRVSGGTVLVLEVYQSPVDLHMVSGYDDFRFYRRGPKGTIKMTEPEIREAYAQIAATKRGLDHDVQAAISSEVELSRSRMESIYVVPWNAAPNLADPRLIGSLGGDLATVFAGTELAPLISQLRLGANGYRGHLEPHSLAVLRNGVVHFASGRVIFSLAGAEYANLHSRLCLAHIVEALLISRHVLRRANYWGRFRLLYSLTYGGPFTVDESYHQRTSQLIETGGIPFKAVAVDATFAEIGDHFGRVAKEILDQIFQLQGFAECPYLDREGGFTELQTSLATIPRPLLRFLA